MLAPDDPRHGTKNGYGNLGCRCEACREASRQWFRERGNGPYRKVRCGCGNLKSLAAEVCMECTRTATHGTAAMYRRQGCRCEACREAANEARREHRHRNIEAARAYDRAYRRRRRAEMRDSTGALPQ